MKKTNAVELPQVSVEIPTIKLNLADLAYMRGLLPGNQRCSCPSEKTKDKLLFLGLIEMVDIPADPEAVKAGDWRAVHKATEWFSGWTVKEAPKSRKEMGLSAAGAALIRDGIAKTKIQKVGCA